MAALLSPPASLAVLVLGCGPGIPGSRLGGGTNGGCKEEPRPVRARPMRGVANALAPKAPSTPASTPTCRTQHCRMVRSCSFCRRLFVLFDGAGDEYYFFVPKLAVINKPIGIEWEASFSKVNGATMKACRLFFLNEKLVVTFLKGN